MSRSLPYDEPKETTNDVESATVSEPAEASKPVSTQHPFRFWAIVGAMAFTTLCSSLEGTIITSALSTISDELNEGDSTVWVPNAYFLATIVILPLTAQASNIYGRRWLTLISVALFTLGSGICGGAYDSAMLIAGRVVQGLGGGGISLMVNIILTDLVSLRERGKYLGFIQMVSSIGAALGPFLGGLLTERSTWRWVFYINVPIGGTSLIALFFFLRLAKPATVPWKESLSRIDFFGNIIFIASAISVLLAVTWGGSVYPWGSYHVLVPLIFGFSGLGLFVAYEWMLAPNPSFPRAVFMNRTSLVVLGVTFFQVACIYWAFYFMPVYFQAVKGESSLRSGVDTLPLFAGLLPFAIIGGIIMSKWGRYKPLHLAGVSVMLIGLGLFSILSPSSSTAAWVCYQLLFSIGAGINIGLLLPAMQAPLEESLVALSAGVWVFIRGFGTVWGTTIATAVFNNECSRQAVKLANHTLAANLEGGQAYEHANQAFLDSISDPSARMQVVQIFSSSLHIVWYVAIAFAGVALLLVWLEKEVPLRSKLQTKYGLEESKKKAPLSEDLEKGESAPSAPEAPPVPVEHK